VESCGGQSQSRARRRWTVWRAGGGAGEPHLVHTVQELQEDGREAAALAAGTQVAPLAELVAKGQPLFLQQHLKTFQGPIERIAQQLHQRHHLQRRRGNTRKRKVKDKTYLQCYQSSMNKNTRMCLCAFLLDCGVLGPLKA